MLAEMMHFYPGLGWGDLLHMDVVWFCKLYRRIAAVEARRLLPWLPIVSFPHLQEDAARQRIQESLLRQSGYEAIHQEELAADRYEAGWAALRAIGRPAQPGSDVPQNSGKT